MVQALYERHDLKQNGFSHAANIYQNLSPAALYEEAIRRQEGSIAAQGPLVVKTGQHTGRSPNDKYIVREPSSMEYVAWGKVNQPLDPEQFEKLYGRVMAHFEGKDLFVQDCLAGADPKYRIPVRVITTYAWHSLFSQNLFIRPTEPIDPEIQARTGFTVIAAPECQAIPAEDGTRSEVFIVIHFGKRMVLIGGTQYGGEIKKSIFTVLNYLLPRQNVLSMHCATNVGAAGDTALFFGLSGTGKTTLSADPNRVLIGDDEHGWSDTGVFNVEGGCYAKVINLSAEAEPEIYATTQRFGTVLENVVMDHTLRQLDLADASLTENTRAAYPIDYIPNACIDGLAAHPDNIFLLTADAFGVLPPIAQLTPEQAVYYFLSGYTAKVAGTEKGVVEPQTTFSTCFGAPFMVCAPTLYGDLFGAKITKHGAKVWLVNTGWSGGPYGVGARIKIAYTRAMIQAALNGNLTAAPRRTDPIFGISVPTQCANVPASILDPRSTWPDGAAYDAQAQKLARAFDANFKVFADRVSREVRAAGPVTAD